MQLFGQGFMITFTEVESDLEADFNEWYNREHLDERIDLPGFRRARRYESLDGPIRYVTSYECREADDIGSPVYLDVLRKQTEWSRRIMPQFSKWHRLLGRVVADHTHGFGAWLALLRLHPDPARAAELEAWLDVEALPALAATPGLFGACAVATVPEVDARLARAFGQEPDTSKPPEWGVLVEGMSAEAVRDAVEGDVSDTLAGFATDGLTVETCRFLYGNQRFDDGEKA